VRLSRSGDVSNVGEVVPDTWAADETWTEFQDLSAVGSQRFRVRKHAEVVIDVIDAVNVVHIFSEGARWTCQLTLLRDVLDYPALTRQLPI